jgi:hypothetical protein
MTKPRPSPNLPNWIPNPTTDRHGRRRSATPCWRASQPPIRSAADVPGRHAAGDDHQQAIALVEEAGDVGREARRHLETLLSIKHKAQYEEVDPAVPEAKRAIRAMRSLLELAAQA